jgi:hypothetical protein
MVDAPSPPLFERPESRTTVASSSSRQSDAGPEPLTHVRRLSSSTIASEYEDASTPSVPTKESAPIVAKKAATVPEPLVDSRKRNHIPTSRASNLKRMR